MSISNVQTKLYNLLGGKKVNLNLITATHLKKVEPRETKGCKSQQKHVKEYFTTSLIDLRQVCKKTE